MKKSSNEMYIALVSFIIVFIVYASISLSYNVILWDATTFISNARVFSGQSAFFEWSLAPFWSFLLSVWPTELFARLMSAFFGSAGVLMLYYLAKEISGKRVAKWSAFLLAANPLYIIWSAAIYSDIPAFVFMAASVLSFLKGFKNPRFFVLSGFMLGIAFLTRYSSILLLVPMLLYLIYREKLNWLKRKEIWIALGLIIVVSLPWLAFNHIHTGSALTSFEKGMLSSYSAGPHEHSFPYYAQNFHIVYSSLIPFFIAGLYFAWKRREKSQILPILIWICFFALLSLTSYKFVRHLIPSFLGITIIAGYGLSVLDKRKIITLISIVVIIGVMVIYFFTPTINQLYNAPLETSEVCAWLNENVSKDSLIMSTNWVYWNHCYQKSIRFFKGSLGEEDYRLLNLASFVKNYGIEYAVVTDYPLYPEDITTTYLEKRNDFRFLKRIGRFTIFKYKGQIENTIDLPAEFVFY